MASLTDIVNEVVEDTGRYDLLDSAFLKSNMVMKAQKFLEEYLEDALISYKSKQFILTTGVYGASLGKCNSVTSALVSETGQFRNELELIQLEDLLAYANSNLDSSNRGIPEYIALGNADDTTFTDNFLASPNANGFIVFPVPDRTVTIRVMGDFLPDELSDASPSTHLYLSDYRHLFVLAFKAQLEFGIRNIEGFNQFKGELITRIDQVRRAKIRTEWASTNRIEG